MNNSDWMGEGLELMKKEQYGLAISFFNKAIENNPEELTAFYNRGICFLFLSNYEEARNDFDQVLCRDDSNPDVWFYSAIALLNGATMSGDFDHMEGVTRMRIAARRGHKGAIDYINS